ncbi:MAG: amidase [Gammaproteobacteria bacterium]|nr:amidase [Gammaproteobacteria bacterium]RPG26651.1 MAG: amidase [Gammaproteobacteria bacterium TMED50]
MDEIAFDSATGLAARLRAGEFSAVELAEHQIRRIEKYDGDINAVVVRDFERGLEAAREADRQLQSKSWDGKPLLGVPMTIKELYHVAGLQTTYGHPELKENVPDWDADAVTKHRAAGAVLLGKTNSPVDGGDFQTYNPVYGTTNNPFDPERTPGGSSGGSAASLAAGFAAVEAGSDIGGSIRNPAHYSGIYGHKPTWGIVPQYGHTATLLPNPQADLVVCGPMARSAEDLRLFLDITLGPEPLEAPGWRVELPEGRYESLSDFRVAIWPTDDNAPVSAEISDRINEVGRVLASCGAIVSDIARPDIDFRKSHEAYQNLLQSIMSAGVSPEQRKRNEARAASLDPNDLSDRAVLSRAMVLSHAGWLGANARRQRSRYQWREFFRDWDILICPQMATTAFKHDHSPFMQRTTLVDNVEQPYFTQIFWAGVVTSPLLPSTVFPTGLSGEGLPIGVQAVGDAYQDYKTIRFADLITQELGGFIAPPAYAD